MHTTLRVTTADPEVARVTIRRHQFEIGRPMELDEASPRISALEYALGAIAGEMVNGLRVFAWRHRVDVDRVEAPEQIFLNPDCGLGTFSSRPMNSPSVALAKLQSIATAASELRAR